MSLDFFKIPKKGTKSKICLKFIAKFSDIWKFTQNIIHNMKIYKLLKNGSKDKNYTIIGKRRSCRI